MRKFTLSCVCLLTICCLLSGCTGNKLAEDFNKEEVKAAAEEIVELVNSDDFDTIIDVRAEEKLKNALTVEDLEKAKSVVMNDAGEFQSFKSVSVIGEKDKTKDQDWAVAIVIAQYENQKVTYTITFDSEMELIGIYMK